MDISRISLNSRAYRVYNLITNTMMEQLNFVIDDMGVMDPQPSTDDELYVPTYATLPTESVEPVNYDDLFTDSQDTNEPTSELDMAESGRTFQPTKRVMKEHPITNVIGDVQEGMNTKGVKRDYQEMVHYACFMFTIEPKNVKEAVDDEYWVVAMQEELGEFVINVVWDLVPQPKNVNGVATK